MKYIDAEKIRAEIERLYDGEAPAHDQQCDFDDGYFTGIGAISKFLDTVSEEPVSEDLEESAESYALLFDDGSKWKDGGKYNGFIAEAKWQRKQDELLSKITEEHLEGLRWIIRTGITTQPRPYHKYCKDLLQLLESYKNEI